MTAAAWGRAPRRRTSRSTCVKASDSASRSSPATPGWPKSGSRCEPGIDCAERHHEDDPRRTPMKTFRVVGVDGESLEAARLWELGCLGLIEESGTAGGAILAYFDDEVETDIRGRW